MALFNCNLICLSALADIDDNRLAVLAKGVLEKISLWKKNPDITTTSNSKVRVSYLVLCLGPVLDCTFGLHEGNHFKRQT